MSEVLTKAEQRKLCRLGEAISIDLGCNANGNGLPCRTCRFEAVENMIEYLRIHDIEVIG